MNKPEKVLLKIAETWQQIADKEQAAWPVTGRERLTRAGARREMPAAETTSYIVPLIMLAVALVLILGAVWL
jgi:hypothetical protein